MNQSWKYAMAPALLALAVVPLLYPNFLFGVSRRVTGFDNPHPFSWYFVGHRMGKQ